MNEPVVDPFAALYSPIAPESPRPEFARRLRSRLVGELDITIELPSRSSVMNTVITTTSTAPPEVVAPTLVPYLCVAAGPAALDFYAEAFGAVEVTRFVMDDGRIGHAELRVGAATIYLADEFPDLEVVSPSTLGGTAVTLHLQVPDVDLAFRRAVEAGAVSLGEPADQPHGARHGTLRDPFGHRWMLSTPLQAPAASEATPSYRGVWPAMLSHDAKGLIRFAVAVLGFEEHLVVPDDTEVDAVRHSELRWPEGGVVQIATVGDRSVFSDRPVGTENLYVITTDPAAVHRRCVAAGAEIVSDLAEPGYDAGGSMFTVRDPDGNLWTFGSYAG